MQKSIEQDIHRIENIIKWIENIKLCFKKNNINNSNNLKNDVLSQVACTQLITNIYEDKKRLQDVTFNKLVELNKIKLAMARNIASHDYDNVEFIAIYSISKQLIKPFILSELYRTLGELEEEND